MLKEGVTLERGESQGGISNNNGRELISFIYQEA